ncbi:hypothetical protein [Flavobacterium reichenbachii]|uniref:Uncharacterized protein n=1 Tax=Flavobacterium reichenbachii TaxID=362418 RepID=A0A085ZNR7_9FLAO|nr:hypothetical protein [Flavobacterium reichenbachii]KFF06081.1 hypothetical protein IW19_11330 [Flavobacterium reichenbachii]OXB14694.1 hypothetical protein B0A68_11615 [Flavobacterium reichenbachii]
MKFTHNKKLRILFILLALCSVIGIKAQNTPINYVNRITSFSKPFRILYNNVDKEGNGSIELTNKQNQILRFQLLNYKLQVLHGGIAFQLFYYDKHYLQRLETFDQNGKPAGEHESQNEAAVIFMIEKPDIYLQKKKLIDDAEGNINMRDDTSEKIIRIKFLDENNLAIPEQKTLYISTKTYWNYNHRMYWP